MSGQHSQATSYRAVCRRLVRYLEQANEAAKELPHGWDSEIRTVQDMVRKALAESQRMVRNANAMVATENERLENLRGPEQGGSAN